jgi:hypothetical protein
MSLLLKQSTAVVLQFGPFVDKADGFTILTGLVSALDNGTTGIKLSKNGGSLAVRHASVTASSYDANGCYKVTLDTTDTNTLGTLRMIYTDGSTTLPVWMDLEVVTANVWDTLFGSSNLDTNLVTWLGSAPNALSSGNVPTGAGGDPWATALPGSYTTGQAGKLIGDNINASIAAVKAKTDSLTFTAAGYVDANTRKVAGTDQTARDIGASVLLSNGTGTGQVSLSSGAVKVQINTKTNTALPGFTFTMVDTAGVPRTGLTVAAQRSIDGGAFASCANSVSEISNGFYTIDLATSDMNGAVIALRFTATGAQDKPILIITTP